MAYRLKAPLNTYRIADRRFPIFNGFGPFVHGARWSPPGYRVVYGSLSMTCAMLEVLVHANTGKFPKDQVSTEIRLPKGLLIEEVLAEDAPGWDKDNLAVSLTFGQKWLDAKRTAVLIVPSKITLHDKNILINLDHPDAARIRHSRPRAVAWDARLKERFGGHSD
ncbi:MAG: RES family NAD+ phosphorylase [Sulfuricaulis sp.]